MTDQQHYLKFKKILEVYCKHAEYISERAKQGEAKSPSANYRETHKKRYNNKEFSEIHNLDNASWNEIEPGIYIDMHFLNPHNGSEYNSESFSYMNIVQGRGEGFDGTWINIVPSFDQQKSVIGFRVGYSEKALKNTDDIARSLAKEYPVRTSPMITTDQLGLFDGSDKPTQELLYSSVMNSVAHNKRMNRDTTSEFILHSYQTC